MIHSSHRQDAMTDAPEQPRALREEIPQVPQAARPALDGAVRSGISQAMTQIHAEYYGKGATQAKTYAFENLIVCVLRDVFTTVERTLIDVERAETVREVRTTFQHTLEATFVSAVERLTGRKVASFMSQIDPAQDIAVEVFLLEPLVGERHDDRR
jgi:uncharacterized protein YbcI